MYTWVILLLLFLMVWSYPFYHYKNVHLATSRLHSLPSLDLQTGDIILFVYEEPLYFYAENGVNMTRWVGHTLMYPMLWYTQGVYTHAGMVVMWEGSPHVMQLGGGIQYDSYTQSFVMGRPYLQPLEEVLRYQGSLFLYQRDRSLPLYTSSESDALVHHMMSQDILFDGNYASVIMHNGLKLQTRKEGRHYMCTDFVEMCMYSLGMIRHVSFACDMKDLQKLMWSCGYRTSQRDQIQTWWTYFRH